jgi:hypothetical protein
VVSPGLLTVQRDAPAPTSPSSDSSSSIDEPAMTRTNKAKAEMTKAWLATKEKVEELTSPSQSGSESDLYLGKFVSKLEPAIAKNIDPARAVPSNPTPKRKAEKKAPAEGSSRNKRAKLEVEVDPFEELDKIAGKPSLSQAATLSPLKRPKKAITPKKSKK